LATNGDPLRTKENQISLEKPGPESPATFRTQDTFNPVTVLMHNTLGAIFLGILTIILLIGWMRAEARNRKLVNLLSH
jgi:hypothetical protein